MLYQLSYMGTLNTDFILMRKATKNHLPLAFLSEKPEGLVRCLSFFTGLRREAKYGTVPSVSTAILIIFAHVSSWPGPAPFHFGRFRQTLCPQRSAKVHFGHFGE